MPGRGVRTRWNGVAPLGGEMELQVKRAYAAAAAGDGFRVYVDRLWPRGLSRANFKYDLWAKDVAPSAALRRWFHEDPESRREEFARRYRQELAANPAVNALWERIEGLPRVTFLYSSRDREHNNALVLLKFIKSTRLKSARQGRAIHVI